MGEGSRAELASIGDIIGIRDSIQKFVCQHPESGAFFSKLRQLAAELRLLDIQGYLHRYLKD